MVRIYHGNKNKKSLVTCFQNQDIKRMDLISIQTLLRTDLWI